MTNDTNNIESMPYEVKALCSLLARIMHRCLVEKDARFIVLISVPVVVVENSEVMHDQAA